MSILNLDALLENQLEATGELDPKAPGTRLHFANGQTVVIPTELLLQPVSQRPPAAVAATSPHTPDSGEAVIPLVEEHLEISKREVETARVRLRRETEEYLQNVTVPLNNVSWEVEHIPVGQVVAQRPETRQAGDTLIFPLVEERLVVTRELFLREEVHVRKVTTTVEKSAQFPLKRDILIETRTETESS